MSDVIFVVPARGGSIGVRNKALRVLGDRPVLAHTIATLYGLGPIVVTTDDPIIGQLAKEEGAWYLPEPQVATQRALDAVVHRAIQETAQRWPAPLVATVQCTSPFLKRETVQRALAAVREGFDTALTVRDDRGLRWERAALETTREHMPARVPRQQMPPTWRETGGCLVTRREYVTDHARIGPRVKLIPVEGREALDLDTEDDWLLAELYAAQVLV